ncbi:CAP domain-containing protein [Geodermatophilus obscurus]|uniref:CAP domain-containing protein n=1 Tax=Geodermatophilus obscurus TaxID=1861 RepID=UPI001FCC0A64|nr:CAP domain-containing protein [Geodermatophilus obscurus]
MPLLLVVGAVAVVTVGAPMVSGAVTSFTDPVALESTATSAGTPSATAGTGGSSSSSRASADAPLVRMGVDGDPAPQTSAAAPATPPAGTSTPAVPSVPATGAPERPSASAEVPVAEEPAPAVELPAVEAGTEPAPVARATAAAAAPTAEAAVLALVNEARADAGCGALTADPALAAVARAHSADMRDRGYFSHTSPEGLSPFDRAEQAGVDHSRAENIAFGQADAAAVMEAWLESPGHRRNILDCELTKLGVGVAEGPGGPWWTQLFGA